MPIFEGLNVLILLNVIIRIIIKRLWINIDLDIDIDIKDNRTAEISVFLGHRSGKEGARL